MTSASLPSESRPTSKSGRWISDVFAVYRNEWRQFIYAPVTAIFQVGFLIALNACIFLIANFYATDVASIALQWTFLPWVALVFVPALAMRAFTDDPGDRALELTLSMPLARSAIIVGKWAAGLSVLCVSLLCTFPFVLTIAYLGDPEWGVVAAGYFGALGLLAVYFAVALFAAALVREPVSAYVVGLGFLVLLSLFGWDVFGRLLSGTFAEPLSALLVFLSPKHWLDRMAAGRIELAAVLYFVLTTGLALLATTLAMARRRLAGKAKFVRAGRDTATVVLLAGAAAVVIAVTLRLPTTLDLTDAREFTLHDETRAIARNTPEGIAVDFYWSEGQASVPASIRLHADRVERILFQLASLSDGHITIRTHDVSPDSDAEETALAAGVRRVPMSSGDNFFLGAVFHRGDRQGVISYFDEQRSELLEYDVALAIDNLSRDRTPRIGIISPALTPSNATEPRPGLAFLEDVKRQYDVAIIPHFSDTLPEDLDALIVMDATILKSDLLYQIDQHVMAGKGLIVMIDPHARFNSGNAAVVPQPSEVINDISDLLLTYGARFLGEGIVGDSQLASPVVGKDQQQLNYPFWLRVPRSRVSSAHPVTASLNDLLFGEAGSFELTGRDNAVALITTTEDSGTLPREDFKNGDPARLEAQFKPDGKPRVIAVALGGPFKSAFGATGGDGKDSKHHRAETNAASVFAISDADWLYDPMALQNVTVGDRNLSRPLNDNVTFLLNMIEHAAGNPRLIGIRSRGRLARPFTRVAEMLRDASARYQEEERKLITRIARVEGDIRKVLELASASRTEQLPDEIRARVNQLSQALLPYRRDLRRIRASMRDDVERLGQKITVLNLAAGPLLVALFAGLMWSRRRRPTLFSGKT
ncbi:ABC-2 type transport system permease protein [Filomicrobium insigne]|uniref:ABC-2 type transport system permease protein n=1 Tax=Filomicrobium insigne TaxID=418854 RepID=A0A1H0PQH8_9HYPH|nr:Gldg family protein [Filomicrobium insigne]SDP06809.1 ABC-2 type transport system permease protein [Filomicrobium insigne]